MEKSGNQQQPPEKKKPTSCEPVPTDGSSNDGTAPKCPEGYPEEQPTDTKSEMESGERSDRHSTNT